MDFWLASSRQADAMQKLIPWWQIPHLCQRKLDILSHHFLQRRWTQNHLMKWLPNLRKNSKNGTHIHNSLSFSVWEWWPSNTAKTWEVCECHLITQQTWMEAAPFWLLLYSHGHNSIGLCKTTAKKRNVQRLPNEYLSSFNSTGNSFSENGKLGMIYCTPRQYSKKYHA